MASRQAALWMGTVRWEARRQSLFAGEPLCRMCAWFGRTSAAFVADHCVPHRDDPDLFWNGDLQPLCSACHDGPKQAADLAGYYELVDADGWVVRIGLEGGFPRIGDDLCARAVAFERGEGGSKSPGAVGSRPAATPNAELVFQTRARR